MSTASTASTLPLQQQANLNDAPGDYQRRSSSYSSAVSWGAIVAGAMAGASLSLILLILGVGLGLSSVSPWAPEGISATSFGISTIVWLIVTQLLASALGGYLAGRLRTKWLDVQTDEIYFRDTAHGFLAWAVASLATAALLTSVVGSILNGGVQAGSAMIGGVANTAAVAAGDSGSSDQTGYSQAGPTAYFVDYLFRQKADTGPINLNDDGMATSTPEQVSARDLSEVGRIFMNASRSDPMPAEDVQHVAQLVAQRTGISPQEAEQRVAQLYSRAQKQFQNAEIAAMETVDEARKASAKAALWIFVSLLIGAFVASLAATLGGRQRDAYPTFIPAIQPRG